MRPRTAFCSGRCNKELPMSSFPPGQVSHLVGMKLCVACAEPRYTCNFCHFKNSRRGFGERPARGEHPVCLKCNVIHFFQGCEERKYCAAFSPEKLNPRAHRQGSRCKGCIKTATERTSKYVVLRVRGSFLFRVLFLCGGGEVCVCNEHPHLLRPDMGCRHL
jgi:hypothetical protein